ncbi:uncharacterized protein MONBRDRAFT_38017 [Monosiga brevicollis MX1]|uniref:Photosynthesis system II assembly factor Ycf48/Hcf136-like domain-containing protein n=1 Tax=Monosiga brevicollis TaxID=81824 RepID=A9V575_MONBE|nr:uncharacterized protein MONBRDRAFT_38017 [Monosiga brevicollis MX1]EDQ87226.1 predicted protein [Monosiga brevicollis MX1]|eukprot:XP_001747839.1 hypothetical protein [Monosiga brevicollis MX1]
MKATICVLATAVALATATPGWNLVAENLLTTELGIGFHSETEGFIAGDANGEGPAILKSTDGGKTWNASQADFGADALLLALGVADDTVIVTSIFGELYSNDDGDTFERGLGGGLSQSVRYLGKDGDGGSKFGCAGQYRGHQGIALTTDGGKLWKPVFADKLFTAARYAAFPSDSVWYIAAGEWPESASDDQPASNDDMPTRSPRLRRSDFQDADGYFPSTFSFRETRRVEADNGYKAQIVKSTDGGKTWVTQFAQNGTFYFNGIDCTSEDHCCAVGESSDPPFLGAGIWCTQDGTNWNRTFYAPYQSDPTVGFSLLDIRWASETVGWAIGGELNSLAPKAWFVKTTDGGKTWDPLSHQIFGYYAMGLDVVNENVAYAAVDNLLTQTSGVAKFTSQ